MSSPLIKINGLVKKYGERVVVQGVSLSIEEGEIFGLLGPNGAGKTTILSILSTLLVPDKGNVTISDHALARTEAQLSGVTILLLITLSAVGGCFVPRFIMPEWLRTIGLVTPHAWALDAYQDLLVRGVWAARGAAQGRCLSRICSGFLRNWCMAFPLRMRPSPHIATRFYTVRQKRGTEVGSLSGSPVAKHWNGFLKGRLMFFLEWHRLLVSRKF